MPVASILRIVVLVALAWSPAAGALAAPPHVVLIAGEGEYRSEVTMAALAERLTDVWGWRTTLLLDEALHASEDNHVPGLDALEDADLVVLYLRFRQWPDADLAALEAYVERGGAIAAFRTTTHAFAYEDDDPRAAWNDFGAEVLGAPWLFHYGHDSATDAIVATGGRGLDRGILDGVPDAFRVRSWTYHVRPDFPPATAQVLMLGMPVALDEDDPGDFGPETLNPIAWTHRSPGGGRVFMTTMGHPEDFHVAGFRRLIGNGLHWALDRPIPDETLPDFPEVLHPDDEAWDDAGGDAPWQAMDYGPFLSTAVDIGGGLPPVTKGLVIRLRTPDGAATDLQAIFDPDLLAWRCVWTGELLLYGIVYDGPHGTFPEIDGDALLRTAPVPGIARADGEPRPDPRAEPWGPIPPAIGRWSGLTLDGDDVVLRYTVSDGRHEIHERLWATEDDAGPDGLSFVREITVRSASGTTAGPVLRHGDGHIALPADGTVYAGADGRVFDGRAVTGAAGFTPVAGAIARADGRWGDPVVTRGTTGIRDQGGADDRTIVRRAGDPAETVEILTADGGTLAAVSPTVVVRTPAIAALDLRTEGDDAVGWWPSDTGQGAFERNALRGRDDLRLDGVTWRRGVVGRSLDFDGTAAAWIEDAALDLATDDLTVATWIATRQDGTIFAVAPPDGQWVPDGMSLFLRDGRLAFDIGWVGVVSGGPRIDDGAWHHVAASWRAADGAVALYVDGERIARGALPLEEEDDAERQRFAPRFGWTADDFPETSRFSGYMDGPVVLRRRIAPGEAARLAAATGEPIVAAVALRGPAEADPITVSIEGTGIDARAVARFPASDTAASYDLRTHRAPRSTALAWARDASRAATAAARPFRIDRIEWPADTPYASWMRFGALDFAADDDTAAYVTTWSGDVWRVDGLDEDLDALRWTRFATGLNQPFGLVVHDGRVLVLGRDQITHLRDTNGDGEADAYDNFSNLARNGEHFHEPASGLLVTPDGDFLYHKAARHALLAEHLHHGTVVHVSADGRTQTPVAHGFRAPMGLGRLPDGSLLGSDQEGHWTPANRINLIRPVSPGDLPRRTGFHGNGWGAPREAGRRIERDGDSVHAPWSEPADVTPPLCWIHPSVDRSPSAQLFVDHEAWGPLRGSILGLSYGTGEVYLVLRDDVATADGVVTQGGIVKLGIEVPTGLLAGRIHPRTGDLYVCGLVGWSSDQPDVGGVYRVRPQPGGWATTLNVPTAMRARPDGLELTFLHPLDPAATTAPGSWDVQAWNYRRRAEYGSADYDLRGRADERTTWDVRDVTLSDDGRTVRLRIADFEPAMQVHVAWSIADAAGQPLVHDAHLTVHAVHTDAPAER